MSQSLSFTSTALFASLSLSLIAVRTQAADWAAWRGPDQNGISAESGWKPAGIAKELWKKNVNAGYSTVAVADSRLFTMGNADEKDTVYCLNPETGAEIWTFSYPCGKGGGHAGPRATPVVDGDRVYTCSLEGDVHCLEVASGKKIWQQAALAQDAERTKWDLSGSPLVVNSLVLINVGDHGAAFDKQTGRAVWQSPGTGGYATPVIFGSETRSLAAIFGQNAIHAVDVKTGRKVWALPWQTKHDINAADPVLVEDDLFISSGYGRGCALLDVTGDMPKVKWQNTNLKNHFTSAIALEGNIIGCDGNTGRGKLVSIDAATGEVNWSEDLGFGAPILVDGKIIFLNEKGTVTIGIPSKTGFKVLASHSVIAKPGKCWNMPVLSNGLLYCRGSRGPLVCLDLR